MPGLVAINNIIEANKDLIPDKYQLRDGRIGLDICQDTFWNLLLALLVHGTKTPNIIRVGYEKLAFTVEPQEWQLFLNELGLQNDQEIEAFRHLLTTLLRGEELQTVSPYATLMSDLPEHTLTLITFIGQAALRYLQSHSIRFNESDYPYEEGKLTEYWYEHIHRFTTKHFEERVQFIQFCQWAYIRLNRQRLYRIFIFAFILPAKKAISTGLEKTLPSEFEQTPSLANNGQAWNEDPKEIARLLKKTEVANVPVENAPESNSLFRSRFKQVLATMNAEFEKRLTKELDEFESSYEMLRRELVTLRDQNTQKTQEIAIKTLNDLLDPILRNQTDVDKTDSITRVFLDNIAVGTWCLEGKIGEIVSEEDKDRYDPDPEKMLSSQKDGQLTITRCGLKVDDVLLLPPFVVRKNP